MEYITSQIAFKGQDADPTLALTEGTITLDPPINKPWHGGNAISIDVAQASNGVIEYTSRSYPTTSDFTERPGAVVEYNINFGNSLDLELAPSNGYIPAYFLESAAKQYIETGVSPTTNTAVLCEAQTNTNTGAKWLFSNANAAHDENPDKKFWMTSTPNSGKGSSYIGLGSYTATTAVFEGVDPSAKNIYGLKIDEIIYGGISRTLTGLAAFSGAPTVTLFRHRRDTTAAVTRFWWCKFTEAGEPTRDYVPCLDSTGKPCMLDKVTREPYYNANSTTADFTVGMTVAQARRLGSLPADAPTKTLTLSLPKSAFVDVDSGEIADAAVNAALAQAKAKGWDITIQTYTEA